MPTRKAAEKQGVARHEVASESARKWRQKGNKWGLARTRKHKQPHDICARTLLSFLERTLHLLVSTFSPAAPRTESLGVVAAALQYKASGMVHIDFPFYHDSTPGYVPLVTHASVGYLAQTNTVRDFKQTVPRDPG